MRGNCSPHESLTAIRRYRHSLSQKKENTPIIQGKNALANSGIRARHFRWSKHAHLDVMAERNQERRILCKQFTVEEVFLSSIGWLECSCIIENHHQCSGSGVQFETVNKSKQRVSFPLLRANVLRSGVNFVWTQVNRRVDSIRR